MDHGLLGTKVRRSISVGSMCVTGCIIAVSVFPIHVVRLVGSAPLPWELFEAQDEAYRKRVLPGGPVRVAVEAAARMGWALQDVTCLSVHGRRLSRVRPALHDGARLLLLSWDGHTAARLAAWLTAQGFGPSQLSVLAHLGGDAERRVDGHAESWATAETEALNTIAVRCVAAPGTRALGRTPGRPERLFAHDGQISKREVRAAILALLAPGQNETLWDIGAGSGAIAIEWMLSDRSNRAVAIEARADRLDRVRANAEALGVPALETVAGRAPDALAGLSPPNAVFIGGGNHGFVPRTASGLHDVLHPTSSGVIEVVPEGEKGIGGKRHAPDFPQPLAAGFCGNRLRSFCEERPPRLVF